jgi:hypothetical protein
MTPNQTIPLPEEKKEPVFSAENFKPSESDIPPVKTAEGVPVRTSHSHYMGMYDYNNNEFARKERFIQRTYVGKSKLHGYGVFAKEDIKAGEIIEECQALLLDSTFKNNKDWVLQRYAMTWTCGCDVCRTNGNTMAIMMGNGSQYNHSETPNSYIVQDSYMKTFTYYALTDIPKGTEIVWYYGVGYANRLRSEGTLVHSRGIPDGIQNIVTGAANHIGAYMPPASKDPPKKGCGCGAKKPPTPGKKVVDVDGNTHVLREQNPKELAEPKEPVQFRSMVVPDKIIGDDQVSESKV